MLVDLGKADRLKFSDAEQARDHHGETGQTDGGDPHRTLSVLRQGHGPGPRLSGLSACLDPHPINATTDAVLDGWVEDCLAEVRRLLVVCT